MYPLASTTTYRNDEGLAVPLIVFKNGEERYVFTDDDFSFGCYHRILSKNYADGKSWGGEKETIETTEILLVAWGFSDKLNMNALDVEQQIIIPSMPVDVSPVATEFDKYKVVSGEFRGFNYEPAPEEFVFSVRYRVVSKYNRKCKNTCQ